jgi:hypothetical protein
LMPDPFASAACGAIHDASSTVFRLLSLFPASLFPFCAGVPAIGAGQLARHAIAARSGPWLRIASLIPPSVDRTPLSASAAVGAGQLDNFAAPPSFSVIESCRPRLYA